MSKFQVKHVTPSEISQWELHELEEITGLTLADYRGDTAKNPPVKLAIGLLWLAAKRTGVADLTLKQASEQFEFLPDETADEDPAPKELAESDGTPTPGD